MAKFQIQKAVKQEIALRLALIGLSGSGKTFSALKLATEMIALMPRRPEMRAPRIRLIDSERKSARKYGDIFDFEDLILESHSAETYVEALEFIQEGSIPEDITIIDSISHAWIGTEGILEQHDQAVKRSRSGNSFNAWRDVTPMHNRFVNAMLACRTHLIVTMRTKTRYAVEEGEKNGRASTSVKKVGVEPVQRDGLEYEFDVIGDLVDMENNLIIGKTRCSALSGKMFTRPGKDMAKILVGWLTSGAPRSPEEPKPITVPEEDEQTKKLRARIEQPTIKLMFDALDTPPTQRIMGANKYRADEKLKEILRRRLTEAFGTDNLEEIAAKKAAKSSAPAASPESPAVPAAEGAPPPTAEVPQGAAS